MIFFVESRLYYETIPNVFSYPSALAKFDVVPQLFSVLFFLMLVTLGLGSATGRSFVLYCLMLVTMGLGSATGRKSFLPALVEGGREGREGFVDVRKVVSLCTVLG